MVWLCAFSLACACSAPDHVAPRVWSYPQLTGRSYATAEDPFEPLPPQIPFDRAAAQLGGKLFADPIMSSDRSLTCWSCHAVAKGGTDQLPHPSVPARSPATLNTGTIFNIPFNFRWGRNGKFTSMRAQLDGPVTSRHVMSMSWPELTGRIRAVPAYRRAFRSIYANGVTADNIRDAIVNYERTLLTPNAPFDRFLRGDRSALNHAEQAGYALFKSLGCASCHQGINVGGNMFAKLGVMGDYFADRAASGRGRIASSDYGRFLVTHHNRDRFVFRVPSLRNVACTAPYLHDGSQATLPDVINVMGKYQLGRELTRDQIDKLAAFLRTLTGEYQGRPLCRRGRRGA